MLTKPFEAEDPLLGRPAIAGTGFENMLSTIMPGLPTFQAEPIKPKQEFSWRADTCSVDAVTLLRAGCTAPWTYTPETKLEALALRFCGAGAVETRINGEEVSSAGGTAIITSSADVGRTLLHTEGGWAASATFVFDASLVHACLSDMFELSSMGQLGIRPLLDLETPIGQTLTSLCRTMALGMMGERFLEHSPKAMALLAETIVRLVLEHVPNRAVDDLRSRPFPVVPRHVKRAIDFMHANMHMPIKLADIASAAGVSARTLQIGFKQFRDTTPLNYLQQIRLQAVHRELSTLENTLSIKEVALKWGFCHLGRFTGLYKKTFGCLPSETAKGSLS